MGSVFLMAWFTLLGVPGIAITAFATIHNKIPKLQKKCVLSSFLILLTISASFYLNISFTETLANFAFMAIGYLAFCYLVFSCWRIPSKILRWLVLIVLTIPIIIGYLLGTVGILGLMFVVGDYANKPLHTERFESGLNCRITGWGNVTSDSGYTVHLYRRWNLIPFLEQEITKIIVNETDSRLTPESATCSDALSKYKNNHN